jgi:D-amino-acid oxidase
VTCLSKQERERKKDQKHRRPSPNSQSTHLISLTQQTDSYEFWDTSPDYDIWYAQHVESFRQLSPSHPPISKINARTPPGAPQISHGAYYKAMSINVPQYLLYLLTQAQKHGVEIVKARLDTSKGFLHALKEAEDLVSHSHSQPSSNSPPSKPACFINATGLGARTLCPDPTMYPIRGQTVLVKGEAHSTITRVGVGSSYRTYCIPRPGSGTTILGGTKEENVWDSEPDVKATEEILRRNAWQVPELLTGPNGGFEVLSVQCGLRPGRKGGPRVEQEVLDGGRVRVVHAYGHAGAGYQNSVGSARKVVGLVGESVAIAERLQAKL